MIRRSTGLLAFLIAPLSLPAAAYTGGGNATVMSLGSPSGNCVTWPNSCPTVLNSAAAPLYTLDPTVNASIQSLLTALAAPLPLPTGASTSALQTTANGYLSNISSHVTGNLALDSSIQSLLTALQAPLTFNLPTNAATATNQATANGYLLTLATAQGAQGTGSTFNPPAGGSGILGYLSGIYKAITGNLTVVLQAGSNIAGKFGIDQTTPGTTNGVVVNSSALPGGAAIATNQTNVQSAPGTPQTTAVTIQGNASGLAVPISGSVTATPVSTATQTTNTISIVAITATSGTLIASNASRKFLSIMNIGANSCTVTTVNPAVSGAGTVYASGGPLPSQGGSNQYDSKVPTNAYYAICPAGLSTTFSVEEGN